MSCVLEILTKYELHTRKENLLNQIKKVDDELTKRFSDEKNDSSINEYMDSSINEHSDNEQDSCEHNSEHNSEHSSCQSEFTETSIKSPVLIKNIIKIIKKEESPTIKQIKIKINIKKK